MAATMVTRGWRAGPEQRFPAIFIAYWALLTALYFAASPLRPALIAGTTKLAVWGSAMAGLGPEVLPGSSLVVPVAFRERSFYYLITSECTAALLAILFVAAVLAYPATWRQRSVGLLIGLPLLALLNTMRLVVLGWVGLYVPSIFDAVHQYWYQAFLIAAVGLGWVAWVWLVVGRDGPASPRARRLGASLLVFLGVLGALVLAGTLGGLAQAYGNLLSRLLWVAGGFLYDDPNVTWSFTDEGLVVLYAKSSGLVALFAATPQVPWSGRAKDLARLFLPVLVCLHFTAMLVSYAVARSAQEGGFWDGAPGVLTTGARLLVALCTGVVIPIAIWFAWARRQRSVNVRWDPAGRLPLRPVSRRNAAIWTRAMAALSGTSPRR